ncbi:MAG: tRNA (adenosine(37)-N6)-threonylcarbamoyltransferase complex transferase subunit TsaD [Acidobacteriota bacterium]
MIILGIESSCDETAAALFETPDHILASVIASQVATHSEFGGVVPELASREHLDNICYVVEACFEEASRKGRTLDWKDVQAVAVTRGPGLMGALLVGMAYAKALAYSLGIPFLGVNHLQGHIYSIFLDHSQAELPALSLVVSGGHTSLFYMTQMTEYELIARTRDDAAGEALDKLAKLLGLGYPGGPIIDRLAPLGRSDAIRFSLPKISDQSLDFSFSGLKTAALRHVQQKELKPIRPGAENPSSEILDLLASYQKSIIDQILDRLEKALEGREVRSIHISGGVSCNSELRRRSTEFFKGKGLPVYYPRPALTTDNAVMIAAAATLRLQAGSQDPWSLPADPNLAL